MKFGGVLLGLSALVEASAALNLRLMTYNIRCLTTNLEAGEKHWSVRRPLVAARLDSHTKNHPEALMCFQEVVNQQLKDIHADLGSSWSYVGVGRDDGGSKGEYSPIFYRPSQWKLERQYTLWLSPTPSKKGSKGWDAALPRIVTIANFKHVKTGAPIGYMCTHFDHKGTTAQKNSAELIVEIAEEVAGSGSTKIPVFVAGDLNVGPDTAAYKTIASKMRDAKGQTPSDKRFGPSTTYTGFTTSGSDDELLDYVFVRDPAMVSAWNRFEVVDNISKDGVFVSDHRAILLDVSM